MKKIFNTFINYLAPEDIKCICCDEELFDTREDGLCDKCRQELSYITKSCDKCGREIYDEGKYCVDCKDISYAFDKVYSCLNYDGTITKLIYNLKYGGQKFLASYLASFIVEKIKQNDIKFDILTYVPLNANRQRKRGFNQAELIANEVAKRLGITTTCLLRRVKDTSFQARLSREERIDNLKDAFELIDKKAVKGKTILLLDDIFTTGTTMSECSKLLKSGKAKSVLGITLSHAKKKFV